MGLRPKSRERPDRGNGGIGVGTLYERILDIGRFTAYIEWYLSLTTSRTGEIGPAFDDLREEDLFIYLTRPSPDVPGAAVRRGRTERLLRQLLMTILRNELSREALFGQLSFDLGIDLPELHTAGATSILGFDTKVFDDPTHPLALVDRDSATLCLFERLGGEVYVDPDGDSSRGNVADVENVLTRGKSFELDISSALLDRMISTALDERYMRFSVTVPGPLEEGAVEVLDEDTGIMFSRYSRDLIRIRADADGMRESVMGELTIIDPDVGLVSEIDFSTTSDGTLRDMLIEAGTGFRLEFHGRHIAQEWGPFDFRVPPPRDFSPTEGGLHFSGRLSVTYIGVDYDIGYSGTIFVDFDPFDQTFATRTDVPFPDDAGRLLAGFMLSTGGLVAFLTWPMAHRRAKRFIEGEIESRLGSELADPLRGMIPQFVEQGLFRAFFDSFALTPNGATLNGQVEAGRIRPGPWPTSSQVRQVWIHRVSEEGLGADTIEIDEGEDARAVFFADRDAAGSLYFACRVENVEHSPPARFAWLGNEPYRFHFSDARALCEEITYPDSIPTTREGESVTSYFYPEPDRVDGAVLAIRLPWGTCSKIEIRENPTGENLYSLRMVSYWPPPTPFVEIVDEGPWRRRSGSYATNLSFSTRPPPGQARRLHSPGGEDGRPSYVWRFSSGSDVLLEVSDETGASTLSARGITLLRDGATWTRVGVTVDPRRFPRGDSFHRHRFQLRAAVAVTDIFGRTARASETFSGRRLG